MSWVSPPLGPHSTHSHQNYHLRKLDQSLYNQQNDMIKSELAHPLNKPYRSMSAPGVFPLKRHQSNSPLRNISYTEETLGKSCTVPELYSNITASSSGTSSPLWSPSACRLSIDYPNHKPPYQHACCTSSPGTFALKHGRQPSPLGIGSLSSLSSSSSPQNTVKSKRKLPRSTCRRVQGSECAGDARHSNSVAVVAVQNDSKQGVEAIVLGPNQDEEIKDAEGELFSSSSSSSLSSSNDMESLKASDSDEGDGSGSKFEAIEEDSSSEASDLDTDQSEASAERGRLVKKRRNVKPAANRTTDAGSFATCFDLSIPYLDHSPSFALPFNLSSSSKHDERLNTVTAELAKTEADFRAWYMSTVFDRFENELDQVRQEHERSTRFKAPKLLLLKL